MFSVIYWKTYSFPSIHGISPEIPGNIDEEKFAVLYDQEGYSRPNKPVNELVCLEIMKSTFDWSDDELRKEYFFDLRVNYALGREEVGQERLAEIYWKTQVFSIDIWNSL